MIRAHMLALAIAVIAGAVGVLLVGRPADAADPEVKLATGDLGGGTIDDLIELETIRPVPPTRIRDERPRERPRPADARDFPAVTATLRIRGDGLDVAARLIRDGGRIALAFPDHQRAWYFERNTVSAFRFRGSAVDHGLSAILDFSDFDLSLGWIDGWEAAGHAGFDSRVLAASLRATGATESAFGLEFHRFVRRETDDGPDARVPEEVWWNEEISIPLRISWRVGEAKWTQETTELARRADAAALRDPGREHPDYFRADSCDACGSCNGYVGHSPVELRLISPSAFDLLARGLPGTKGHRGHEGCASCRHHEHEDGGDGGDGGEGVAKPESNGGSDR